MPTIHDVTTLLKQRNEQRLALIREEFEDDIEALINAGSDPAQLAALDSQWNPIPIDPGLRRQIDVWLQMSQRHHAQEYHDLAVEMEPFLIAKRLKFKGSRVVQSWFETQAGAWLRVTYKRQPAFAGRRIEVWAYASNGAGLGKHYFGPNDGPAIRAFLQPL